MRWNVQYRHPGDVGHSDERRRRSLRPSQGHASLSNGDVVIFAAGTGNPSSPPIPQPVCAASRSMPIWC
jgi:hypothetical protein